MRVIPAALLLATAAACAPTTHTPVIADAARQEEQQKQFEMALTDQRQLAVRAQRVSHRVFTANAERCKKAIWSTGLYVADPSSFRENMRPAAIKVYGLNHDMPVVVHSENPAIKPGDFIAKANGAAVKTAKSFGEAIKPLNDQPGDTKLEIIRNDTPLIVDAPRVKTCHYPLLVSTSNAVNAFANGEVIVVTAGMLRFTQSDEELAVIVGHELAHNVEGHIEKQRGNQFAGILLGAVIAGLTGVNVMNSTGNMGAMAFSQEFEAEADYVGLYYTVNAGYDIKNAPNLWRRMAVQNPGAIGHGSTHPDTASRFLALEKAVAEIEQKTASGEALMPFRKNNKAAQSQAGSSDPPVAASGSYQDCLDAQGGNSPGARIYCSQRSQ